MDKFTELVHSNNKNNFFEVKRNHYIRILREDIFRFLINGDENDFFDINKFNKTYLDDEKMCESIFSEIIQELEEMGWKYKICFGGTGIFFYTSENPPASAW